MAQSSLLIINRGQESVQPMLGTLENLIFAASCRLRREVCLGTCVQRSLSFSPLFFFLFAIQRPCPSSSFLTDPLHPQQLLFSLECSSLLKNSEMKPKFYPSSFVKQAWNCLALARNHSPSVSAVPYPVSPYHTSVHLPEKRSSHCLLDRLR